MVKGKNPILDGSRELNYVTQKDVYMGNLFSRIIDAVNNLAANVGAAAVGKLPPPPPVNAINVAGSSPSNGIISVANSELLHLTLTHNSPIQRNIRYFTEVDTSPDFIQPHVIDHGTSRSVFVHLPTQDSNGNTQTYYVRSYAQYPGGDPCKPYVLGGLTGAIGIQMGGSSKLTLLPSTGSGTASPTGQQGAKGLGDILYRPAPGPKRSVA